ncbi:hypothetical protein PYCC9005_004604 [Savitreella phatthalungensis]
MAALLLGVGGLIAKNIPRKEKNQEYTPRSAFTTFGMFIIDRIVEADGKVVDDVIGGAGTFAAIGARMFSRPYDGEYDDTVGFIVDYGQDTPASVEVQLRSYGLDLLVRRDASRLCTRGLNTYTEKGVREFSYLTPKKRITPADLPGRMMRAACFHLVCTPQRACAILDELPESISVWEPIPDGCFRGAGEDEKTWWAEFVLALQRVSVVSPNLHELGGILGHSGAPEELARELLQRADIRQVVVRCGEEGCLVAVGDDLRWLPAYAQNVVDTTGAGNTFCGALGRSLVGRRIDIDSLCEAAANASVAAGLACQQVGLPSVIDNKWNGLTIEQHLERYRELTARSHT